jgi:hypothetical protein
MDQPVADRIGDAGFANGGMPGRGRELAGNQRRGAFTAIFQHLEQIPPLSVGQRREQPIRNATVRTTVPSWTASPFDVV